MNLENFMIRDKRRAVEHFKAPENWAALDLEGQMTLSDDIAGLPSSFEDADLPAKQFDLLILNAQLLLLREESAFTRLQDRIKKFAAALEGLSNVPTVARQIELILELQDDSFWADVTVEILEDVRKRLRGLVGLIEVTERKVVITDFEDELGNGEAIDLPEVGSGVDKARFKMKVRRFVEAHINHIALQKIRRAEPVTQMDLDELQRMLIDQGVADTETLEALKEEEPLGRFLRRLVGLDRVTAKAAFSSFIAEHQLNPDQTEFIDMIIDHLTDGGIVEPKSFYESPFSDIDDLGIAGLFDKDHASEIIGIVRMVNDASIAA
jgi:type I restriction enzyme R subunit